MNAAVIVVLYGETPPWLTKMELDGVMVIAVDNTPGRDLALESKWLDYIPLNENLGIAKAQNVGLRKADELECEFSIFFDQDSEVRPEYIAGIVQEYIRIEKTQDNLFLLGPVIKNKQSKEEYRSVVHHDLPEEEGFVQRCSVISSGSCVRMSKVEKVGGLLDALFIDDVDHEWCWRAEKNGFVNGITKRLELEHMVGRRLLKFPCGYGVIISAPTRYYYQYRNYLWLRRLDYVPKWWKRNTGIKLLARMIYFPLTLRDGWKMERNMWRGIRDGLKPYIKLRA